MAFNRPETPQRLSLVEQLKCGYANETGTGLECLDKQIQLETTAKNLELVLHRNINETILEVFQAEGISESPETFKAKNPEKFKAILGKVLQKISAPDSAFYQDMESRAGLMGVLKAQGFDFLQNMKDIGSNGINSIGQEGAIAGALKAGGITLVVSSFFGLSKDGGSLFSEVFNGSAWASSVRRNFKSSAILASLIATNGAPLNAAGEIFTTGTSILAETVDKGVNAFDTILHSPQKSWEVITGPDPSLEIKNLHSNLEDVFQTFDPESIEYKIFEKSLKNPTNFTATDDEIEVMAKNLALGVTQTMSFADIMKTADPMEKGPSSEEIIRTMFTLQSNYVGLALLNNPKHSKRFGERLNFYIQKRDEGFLDVYQNHDLEEMMNSEKIEKINEIIQNDRATPLGKFFRNGLSGGILKVWGFLFVGIPLVQGLWIGGRKIFFSEEKPKNKEDRAKEKITKGNGVIKKIFEKYTPKEGTSTEDPLSGKDWREFRNNLVAMGILSTAALNKAFGNSKEKSQIFHILRKDKNFLTELGSGQTFEGKAKTEKTIKEAVKTINQKRSEKIPILGELIGNNTTKKQESKRAKSLGDLITLTYALQHWKEAEFSQENTERSILNPRKYGNFLMRKGLQNTFRSGRITTRPWKSFRSVFGDVLKDLGVPKSELNTINWAPKKNNAHIAAIETLAKTTINFYRANHGDIVQNLENSAKARFPNVQGTVQKQTTDA